MDSSFSYTKAMLGFMAFLSLVLVTLLTRDSYDPDLTKAVSSISLALPALLFHVALWQEITSKDIERNKGAIFFVSGFAGLAGYLCGIVALIYVFKYFSDLSAILFGTSIIIWMAIFILIFRSEITAGARKN